MCNKTTLENYSVLKLKEALKNNGLSTDEKSYIETLIKKRKKENKEFATKVVDSQLFNLAKIELKRRGKATRIKVGERVMYDYNMIEILIVMQEIVSKISGKND